MDTDVLKLIAFALCCLWTRQAFAVLALHVGNLVLLHLFVDAGAIYFLLVSAMFAVVAASNIKFLSNLRWALFAIGVLNWWAAVDFLVWPEATWFYQAYPYLVNGLDAAVLLLLWGQGGKSVVGKFFAVGHGGALPVASSSLRRRDSEKVK